MTLNTLQQGREAWIRSLLKKGQSQPAIKKKKPGDSFWWGVSKQDFSIMYVWISYKGMHL